MRKIKASRTYYLICNSHHALHSGALCQHPLQEQTNKMTQESHLKFTLQEHGETRAASPGPSRRSTDSSLEAYAPALRREIQTAISRHERHLEVLRGMCNRLGDIDPPPPYSLFLPYEQPPAYTSTAPQSLPVTTTAAARDCVQERAATSSQRDAGHFPDWDWSGSEDSLGTLFEETSRDRRSLSTVHDPEGTSAGSCEVLHEHYGYEGAARPHSTEFILDTRRQTVWQRLRSMFRFLRRS